MNLSSIFVTWGAHMADMISFSPSSFFYLRKKMVVRSPMNKQIPPHPVYFRASAAKVGRMKLALWISEL